MGWLANLLRPTASRRRLRAVKAPLRVHGRYDAAATTEENRRHWANADLLSAAAANSPEVRRILRSRARYEVANNSYARGITLTLANDCIGTGPRLQMLTEDAAANRLLEKEVMAWGDAVNLAEKLRTLRMARAQDGEGFLLLVANPELDCPVKLDLRLIEADQVATPGLGGGSPGANAADGIVYDRFGNPLEYHLLRSHPGDGRGGVAQEYDRVPTASMVHYFRPERPGQRRGIPEITPALPLFAQLRRYTLAVLAAAETAADFAAVLYTDAPATGEAADVEPMDLVELERRMATVLPGGWRLGQVQAQQPVTGFREFCHQVLNEIARCLNMPFGIAAGNSAGYNYASGRLDHQIYHKAVRVDQAQLGLVVLDRVLAAWLAEAVLIADYLPAWLRTAPFHELVHQWFWDGQEHVDPTKEANATAARLVNHTTTLAYEYARMGRDWESELRQRAKEVELLRQLGLADSPASPGADQEPPTEDPQDQEEEEDAPNRDES